MRGLAQNRTIRLEHTGHACNIHPRGITRRFRILDLERCCAQKILAKDNVLITGALPELTYPEPED